MTRPAPALRAGEWFVGRPALAAATVVLLAASSVGVQILRDRRYPAYTSAERYLYVPSGRVLERLALSHDALLADVYWIRAIQHYGGTKRSKEPGKQYGLLYPLLDITTTLDPRFNIAYRFGAIFLAEAYPNGPGRPDLAVGLLRKGLRAQPQKWQYMMDIGFVYYWWLHDYTSAAWWFERASQVPGSSWWLKSLAATTLAAGGDREASRLLWQQIYESADNDWLRADAARRLAQLRALDDIAALDVLVRRFVERTGAWPDAWARLVAAGSLRGVPLDPAGTPYVLEGPRAVVRLDPRSPLVPLPTEPPAAGVTPRSR